MRKTNALDFTQAWISKPAERDYTWKPSQLLQSSSIVFENSSISLEEGPQFCSAQSQCTSLSTLAPRKSMLHFPTLFQALNVAKEGCLHFQWQRGCTAMLLCMGKPPVLGITPHTEVPLELTQVKTELNFPLEEGNSDKVRAEIPLLVKLCCPHLSISWGPVAVPYSPNVHAWQALTQPCSKTNSSSKMSYIQLKSKSLNRCL